MTSGGFWWWFHGIILLGFWDEIEVRNGCISQSPTLQNCLMVGACEVLIPHSDNTVHGQTQCFMVIAIIFEFLTCSFLEGSIPNHLIFYPLSTHMVLSNIVCPKNSSYLSIIGVPHQVSTILGSSFFRQTQISKWILTTRNIKEIYLVDAITIWLFNIAMENHHV